MEINRSLNNPGYDIIFSILNVSQSAPTLTSTDTVYDNSAVFY